MSVNGYCRRGEFQRVFSSQGGVEIRKIFVGRYRDQSGNAIFANSPECFLADLLASGYVSVK